MRIVTHGGETALLALMIILCGTALAGEPVQGPDFTETPELWT